VKLRSIFYLLIIPAIILPAALITSSCSSVSRSDVQPQPEKQAKLSITTKQIDLSKGPATRFGYPILAFDADKDGIEDLLWKDIQGTFFLLKGGATEFSEADKADVFEPEDVGGFHFAARKLFGPDGKHHYILASSNKKLVLLDVADLKLKEVFSDTVTTISLTGVCGDIALFGSDINGDGRVMRKRSYR